MNVLIAVAVAALVGVGGWCCWRARKRRAPRMVSLVALLREPMKLDPIVLAKTAGRAWNVDFGDGTSEGPDGFVVCVGPINTIMHGDRGYLVNCIPCPYVEDPQSVAESIGDLRIRQLFGEHQAWFSCDALGADRASTEHEISESYARLAKLLAEFLDENCLLIYVPDTSRAYAINDDTEQALQSDNPLAALDETRPLPVVSVAADDQAMLEAEVEARESWPQFVAAFEASAGENFSVKAPLSYGDRAEYIWVEVTAVEGGLIYGTLGNEPANLGPLKLGSKVCAKVSDLNDWCFIDSKGERRGGFTIAAVLDASRRHQKP